MSCDTSVVEQQKQNTCVLLRYYLVKCRELNFVNMLFM